MKDKELLEEVKNLKEKIKDTSSTNKKVEILKSKKNQKELLYLLEVMHDPFKKFYLASSNLEKNKNIEIENELNIFDILEKLYKREITGNEAVGIVNNYVEKYKTYKEIIYNIIDKNFKIRLDAKLINKAYPGTIKEFSVALAEKIEKYSNEPNFLRSEKYFVSQKIDGVRLITIKSNDKVSFFSRKGKEILTLNVLKEEIIKNVKSDYCVIDGEICLVDEDGNEDFNEIMSYIRKKDYQIPNPKYKIFDFLTHKDFFSKISNKIFEERYHEMQEKITQNKYIDIIEQKVITNNNELENLKSSIPSHWEGLMLRANTNYKGKRSRDLLKIKSFIEDEFEIKGYELGKTYIVENSKEIEVDVLGSVFIEYKGYKVKVGPGNLTLEEKRNYFKNPDSLIGKIVTVSYFGETKNKNETISLRFPTIKYIYDKERNV